MQTIPNSKISNIQTLGIILTNTTNRDTQIVILSQLYVAITKYVGLPTINSKQSSYRYYEDFIFDINTAIQDSNWLLAINLIEALDYNHNIFI